MHLEGLSFGEHTLGKASLGMSWLGKMNSDFWRLPHAKQGTRCNDWDGKGPFPALNSRARIWHCGQLNVN